MPSAETFEGSMNHIWREWSTEANFQEKVLMLLVLLDKKEIPMYLEHRARRKALEGKQLK